MSDNKELYEPDLISVTDDDGNEIVFELLERYETDDDVYVAITEYHDEAEEIVEADNEVIILKVLEENGEEYLAEIEDEMEFEQVSDILMAMVEKKYDVEYFEPGAVRIRTEHLFCPSRQPCDLITRTIFYKGFLLGRQVCRPPLRGRWKHKTERRSPTCLRCRLFSSHGGWAE